MMRVKMKRHIPTNYCNETDFYIKNERFINYIFISIERQNRIVLVIINKENPSIGLREYFYNQGIY